MSSASVLTYLLACYHLIANCLNCRLSAHDSLSIGQSVKLLLALASTVIYGFSLLEIHYQDFCSMLDMYVLRNGASTSTKEGSVLLCRSYVCWIVDSVRAYPRCHGYSKAKSKSLYDWRFMKLKVGQEHYSDYCSNRFLVLCNKRQTLRIFISLS
jgi:hypothetical protein